MPEHPLDGAEIAILVASEGTEEIEFVEPRETLEEAGADVEVIAPEPGEAETVNNDLEDGDTYDVDRSIEQVQVEEYDGLVIPGGIVGADNLRSNDDVVTFVSDHWRAGKPIGSICHGPWALVEADVVRDTTLTSYPSLSTDVENAGGEWIDQEVVVDDNVVTSRNPDDLDAFCERLVETFAAEVPQEAGEAA